MRTVDTVYCLACTRGLEVLEDQVRAIRWASLTSYEIVVMDLHGDVPESTLYRKDSTPVRALMTTPKGFHLAASMLSALLAEVNARQFILMDDTCLITGRGLDQWALSVMARDTRFGLLGVQDTENASDYFRHATRFFVEWELPHETMDQPSPTVHSSFLVVSPRLAGQLLKPNLLVPKDCEDWPASFGHYISWVARMLGHFQVNWGTDDRSIPPLFVVNPRPGLPAPMILRSDFKLYAPCTVVQAYDDAYLREVYRQARGEKTRTLPTVKPIVTGAPVQGPPSALPPT